MNPKTQISLFGKVSELTINYSPKVRPAERKVVTCARSAYEIISENWFGLDHFETFKVLALNKGNKVLGIAEISKGGIDSTVVDPKIIMQYALLSNASSLILAHNHPSGRLNPSESDIKITEKIINAAKFLDISVFDHLIICSEPVYYSFAEEGKL